MVRIAAATISALPERQIRAQLPSPLIRQKLGTFIAVENTRDMIALRDLTESGAFTPVIDCTGPLDQIAAAIRHLLDGQARGKIGIAV